MSNTYTVRNGDTLYGIARRHNITVADIVTPNLELLKNLGSLPAGQTLSIPIERRSNTSLNFFSGASNCTNYTESIKIVDGVTKKPIPEYPYYIESSNGDKIGFGYTDKEGKITDVASTSQEKFFIFLGDDALAKYEGCFYD